MVNEVTITLKGEESSYKQKFLLYDAFQMDPRDPLLDKCIKEACENFKLKPDEIKIKVVMEL